MAASLDDILTVQKNGVVAINNLNQTLSTLSGYLSVLADHSFPENLSATVQPSTTTLIYAGRADLYAISIPTGSGTNTVEIYNSATVAGIGPTNLIWKSLPANSANFTSYQDVRLSITAGIVIKTDATISACVVYSADPAS
jgi:hypothetical protein